MNTNTEITPFLFGESMIRSIIRNESPWFCAKDVCDALGLTNPTMPVKGLEDCEKITLSTTEGNPRAGIPHEINYVSESGLYALIFKSRKAEAVAFRLWVTSEVLPMIRRTGSQPSQRSTIGKLLTKAPLALRLQKHPGRNATYSLPKVVNIREQV